MCLVRVYFVGNNRRVDVCIGCPRMPVCIQHSDSYHIFATFCGLVVSRPVATPSEMGRAGGLRGAVIGARARVGLGRYGPLFSHPPGGQSLTCGGFNFLIFTFVGLTGGVFMIQHGCNYRTVFCVKCVQCP